MYGMIMYEFPYNEYHFSLHYGLNFRARGQAYRGYAQIYFLKQIYLIQREKLMLDSILAEYYSVLIKGIL